MKPLSLQELKKQSYFTEHIRWEVTPKVFLSPQITAENGSKTRVDTTYGYMLYVDLVNKKPAIIIMQLLQIMSRTVGYIDEAPEDLLREAMRCPDTECIAGMYPLTDKLEKWLKNELGVS